MKEAKLWHLLLTALIAIIAPIVTITLWAGEMKSDVRNHEKVLAVVVSDIKRMDNDGPAIWRNTMRFSDEQAKELKRDVEQVKNEVQSQRQILIRIEQQLKP